MISVCERRVMQTDSKLLQIAPTEIERCVSGRGSSTSVLKRRENGRGPVPAGVNEGWGEGDVVRGSSHGGERERRWEREVRRKVKVSRRAG
jgi:hypothetical protein